MCGEFSARVWNDSPFSPSTPQLFHTRMEPLHALLERGVLAHHLPDPLEAVDYGRMVTASKGRSDLHELHAEELSHQVHRHLTRDSKCLGACFRAQALGGNAPFARNGVLDDLGREGGTGATSAFGAAQLVT